MSKSSKIMVWAGLMSWLGFAGFAPLHAQKDGASSVPDPVAAWCQVDDPASWSAARQALIDQGIRELDNIPCPQKETGANLPEVLTLPMPCGRAFVFARIDVPVTHMFDQIDGAFGRSVAVSAETAQTVLSNGPWVGSVAGAFSLDDAGRPLLSDAVGSVVSRSYYMARYELTAPQFDLFARGLFSLPPGDILSAEAPACAAFNASLAEQDLRRIQPQTDLSWFDAVSFANAYSSWLIALDQELIAAVEPPVLPWEQGSTGYIRLPSEAEWEFAARGGSEYATPQTRALRLHTVIDPETGQEREPRLDEICAEAPTTSDVPVAPVGTKLPNRYGLYDVICNAEEIVLDLFRPTRPDGLAGNVGGVLTKGGSSLFLRDANTVGRRVEAQALFTSDGAGRTPTMGTRLMISAPFFTGARMAFDDFRSGMQNQTFESALLEGRQQLLDLGDTLSAQDTDELQSEVERLRDAIEAGQVGRDELEDQVSELLVQLDRRTVSLRETQAENARLAIRTAVVSAHLIDNIGRNIHAAMTIIEDELAAQRAGALATQSRETIELALSRLGENEDKIQASFDLYLQAHSELGAFDREFVFQQIENTRRGLSGANIEVFGKFLAMFEDHHRQVIEERGRITEAMRRDWILELDSYRTRRLNEFPQFQ